MELHLLPPAHYSPTHERRGISGALICSVTVHAAAVAAVLWLTVARSHRDQAPTRELTNTRLVWVATPGPSGGGGGGRTTAALPKVVPPAATRRVESPAPLEVPKEIPPAPAPVEPAPLEATVADTASSGAIGTSAAAPGSGTGGGAGPGDGIGAGPGTDKGFGGNAYRPGNGVTSPSPTRRASPSYTAEAMRARAQGVITVECVVEPSGECGDVRVVHAFEPPFGLDQQALAAARRWRFTPGTRNGEPVRVLVNLEIEFNIR